jgi:hypothetical protein
MILDRRKIAKSRFEQGVRLETRIGLLAKAEF